MTAWVIRAGKYGEHEQWCLSQGRAGGAWNEIGDLSSCDSRADVRAKLDQAMLEASEGLRNNNASQLWGLLQIRPGDLIVLPLKTTKTLAIGTCTKGYEFLPRAPQKHAISVDWKRTDIARSAVKDDLLYTLGAFLTVFKPSRNNAESRLHALLNTGSDPGSLALDSAQPASAAGPLEQSVDDVDVADPIIVPTLEVIRDRVRTYIAENFKSHTLTSLVADILRGRGFVCEVSDPGPDQGVDILAGSGPLGLDSPTLIVEVKSEETQVGAPVVRGLQGAMLSNRSDQGLLVAWGGINSNAKRDIQSERLTMRVWDADDILDQLFDVYHELPEETRRQIPLKQAWVLDDEAG